MLCNEKIGCQHLPFYWSFVLTLNRASALPGKGRGQNILLLYKSRFNIRKNRFRVKSKTSQLWQEKAGDKIYCCYINLVSTQKRIGLESKRKENACFDFQFCHCQLNYQFPLIISLATAFWLFYQLQNWELKQEKCTQPTKLQLLLEQHCIEWTLHLYGNTKRVKFFFIGWKMLCNERFGCQHLPFYWSFVLTLNRASALPGKGRGQNILLPYKSRFNIRKDRFRVKSKTSQLCQEKAGDKIYCCYINLVSIYERIGLESKRKEDACFWLSILPLPA